MGRHRLRSTQMVISEKQQGNSHKLGKAASSLDKELFDGIWQRLCNYSFSIIPWMRSRVGWYWSLYNSVIPGLGEG